MKKALALLLTVAMLMSMLTACGGSKPAAAPAAPAADASADKVYNFKFECVLNEASMWYQTGQKMAQLLDERSNGRLKMECYANAQLAGGNQQKGLENVINNVVQVDLRSAMLWQVMDDKLGIWAVPFFHKSAEHVIDELQYGPGGEAYGKALGELGLKFAGLVEYGPRPIATNKPLTSFDDIQGMKIRVASCALHLDGLKACGANPMAINWSEMYTGLQQGTVDGMEAPYQVLIDNTIYDVCDYIYDCSWVMDPGVVTINQDFYNSLPEDLQKILMDTFKECQAWNIEETRKDNEEAKKRIVEEFGCTIAEFKAEDKAKFEAAMKPVIEAYEASVGSDYLNLFRA